MKKAQTVFVGLSGGVDSSVAALRLQKQGYNVVGVFIKVWHPDFMVCNWEQERLDAMRVAAHLEIPFLTCDAEAAYRDEVAKYFIDEYKAGRTPNPDVMCNKEVKFGAFMEFAKERGADYIATGHYAQRIDNEGRAELHRGVDSNKDQTYFLWTLTQDQLDYSLFPVGDTPKDEIRKEAEAARIPVAEKKDSQGICFLGHVDIPKFLSHYIDLKPGDVLDTTGEVIGSHQDALVYTTGQRHGFTVTNASNEQEALYVINRDLEKNTITVGSQTELSNARKSKTEKVRDVILRSKLNTDDTIEYQYRYRQEPILASISVVAENTIELTPHGETPRAASGQSCVLYRGTHCLGGGIIA